MGTTYNDSRLYLGRTADFPMDPVIKIDWSSGNPYPYAVYARDGQPQGVWFTYQPYGIGDFVYALDNELRYYDAASQTTRLVFPAWEYPGFPRIIPRSFNSWRERFDDPQPGELQGTQLPYGCRQ